MRAKTVIIILSCFLYRAGMAQISTDPDSITKHYYPGMFDNDAGIRAGYTVKPEDRETGYMGLYTSPMSVITTDRDTILCMIFDAVWGNVHDFRGNYGGVTLYAKDITNPDDCRFFFGKKSFGKPRSHMRIKVKAYNSTYGPPEDKKKFCKCIIAWLDYYPFRRGATKVRYKVKRMRYIAKYDFGNMPPKIKAREKAKEKNLEIMKEAYNKNYRDPINHRRRFLRDAHRMERYEKYIDRQRAKEAKRMGRSSSSPAN